MNGNLAEFYARLLANMLSKDPSEPGKLALLALVYSILSFASILTLDPGSLDSDRFAQIAHGLWLPVFLEALHQPQAR